LIESSPRTDRCLRIQAKKGGFKDCLPEDLLAAVFKETLKRSKVDPAKIE
jgi:acetyl-CoA acyltransferase 1